MLTASFLKTPKLRKWSIDQGKPEERNSSNAQIRTLLDEQRQMVIAEYCEKIGQHELQWRQQMDFREVHQQSLTEMEELRKFQSSTFDTLARRKLIEEQNTILELSGRVQELQNQVNCMNDSKDFQDAISSQWKFPRYQSTNVFPNTSDVEAFFRIAAPQRRAAMHLGHTWYVGKRFCKSTCIFISSLSSRIESMGYNI